MPWLPIIVLLACRLICPIRTCVTSFLRTGLLRVASAGLGLMMARKKAISSLAGHVEHTFATLLYSIIKAWLNTGFCRIPWNSLLFSEKLDILE
mgnify:CR=1 FL=1